MTIMFFYQRSYFAWRYPIDSEVIGQYGDFIGGAIGTFITLILLYVTLNLQRNTFESQERVSKKNIELLAIQQLKDKFFSLYDVYQAILEKFSVLEDDSYLKGKSAIKHVYGKLYNKFNHQTLPSVRRKTAALDFVGFYASHKDFAPAYFRTLSLMFEEIEHAGDITIEERLKYVRLLRAQLTDTELVFLRYNAMTPMGVDAIHYINRYNLMKHLPPMELMEYKEWRIRHQMTEIQFDGLNMLLLDLKHLMIRALSGKDIDKIESADERYVFEVRASENFDTLTVNMERDTSKRTCPNDFRFEALDAFTADELKGFFAYFMKDCIVIQNFNRFNVRRDLYFDSQNANDGTNEIVTISVVNNRHHRIAINYEQYDKK